MNVDQALDRADRLEGSWWNEAIEDGTTPNPRAECVDWAALGVLAAEVLRLRDENDELRNALVSAKSDADYYHNEADYWRGRAEDGHW